MSAKSPAPAADLAARILILLARYESSHSSLTEIARRLEASPATCLRVLRTLASHHMVELDERTKRYGLGPTIAAIGSRAAETVDALTRVRPVMAELSEGAGMTAAFVQRVSDDRLMYTQKRLPEGLPHAAVDVSVGNRFPLTDVSYGAWWAADEPEQERAQALVPRPRVQTGAPEDALTLAQVRGLSRTSVLESRGLYVPGVWAASIPVMDSRERLEGVLVLLALGEGLSDERRGAARRSLAAAASRLNTPLPPVPHRTGGDVDATTDAS